MWGRKSDILTNYREFDRFTLFKDAVSHVYYEEYWDWDLNILIFLSTNHYHPRVFCLRNLKSNKERILVLHNYIDWELYLCHFIWRIWIQHWTNLYSTLHNLLPYMQVKQYMFKI